MKLGRISKGFLGLGYLVISLFVTISILSYSKHDPSFNKAHDFEQINNVLGYPGAYVAGAILDIFGLGMILGCLFLLVTALSMIFNRKISFYPIRCCTALFLVPGISLFIYYSEQYFGLSFTFGGLLGKYLFLELRDYSELSLLTLGAIGAIDLFLLSFSFGFSWQFFLLQVKTIVALVIYACALLKWCILKLRYLLFKKISHANEQSEEEATEKRQAPELVKPTIEIVSRSTKAAPKANIQSKLLLEATDFELPSPALLKEIAEKSKKHTLSESLLSQNSKLLQKVLEDFGIVGEITKIHPGPVVTLYEFEPAAGVKSSRVIGLADDIARSMSSISARIAVIPGKSSLGIELPNAHREIVSLRELIEAKSYQDSEEKLPLVLGKNIGGEPVIADLAKMPHLLVAGTTGSGKSVAINTMILSLLYKHSPKTCKFIMVDPKMLELSIYDGIPHLLAPVVTEPKKAITALKWVVKEMENRYRLMSLMGVRNLESYNKAITEMIKSGQTLEKQVQVGFDTETGKPKYEMVSLSNEEMPFIVVIVDEMADLMLVAGKEIESSIQRLAQMARAAGIHLIMATQRPSVDVITGVIKANFPTRISFQVTSKIDSRTILGEQGAEQLLGMGDMLYMRGGGRIERVHGPFVSDSEVEKVTSYLKTQAVPKYVENITLDEESEDESTNFESSGDDLYDKALAIVLKDKKASTSYIQRCLRIGYNRAANLIERMEKEGVVSAPNHVGKREILIQS